MNVIFISVDRIEISACKHESEKIIYRNYCTSMSYRSIFGGCKIIHAAAATSTSGRCESRTRWILQRPQRIDPWTGTRAWTRSWLFKWSQFKVMITAFGCKTDVNILINQFTDWAISIWSFSTSRCASCIGESARAQWFRHSDGWRSGSSTFGSGSGQGLLTSQSSSGHKRSPWDSLPSLRQDSSLNDSGYKSARADSLEQR